MCVCVCVKNYKVPSRPRVTFVDAGEGLVGRMSGDGSFKRGCSA